MTSKPKIRTSDVYLIVDTRERSVIPFVEDSLGRAPGAVPLNFAHVIGQVNTGDYLICRRGCAGEQPTVLAVIERKTYIDFAASFKDGRCKNLDKMLAMRAATGCQLYYFIEGPAFPAPTRRFARIPYANIKAAIVKLQVESGVFIVQTEDEQHTATSLAEFMRAYDVRGSASQQSAAPIEGASFAPAAAFAAAMPAIVKTVEAGHSGRMPATISSPEAPDDSLFTPTVPAALTALVEVSEGDATIAAWSTLRGISVVLGKILTCNFSIADLASKRIGDARIKALRTATGRPINKDAVVSLLSIQSGSEEHSVKVLSGLRNITAETAAVILRTVGGLGKLCATTAAVLEAVSLKQKTRTVKLGKARAERILRILHYNEGKEPSLASSPPAPPPKLAPRSKGASLSRLIPPLGPKPRTAAKNVARSSLDDVFDSASEEDGDPSAGADINVANAQSLDILAEITEDDLARLLENT